MNNDDSNDNHEHGSEACHCGHQATTIRFVIHPSERGKVYDMEPGEEAMDALIAQMCNDGVMTIYTIDENGKELIRSLSKAESAENKKAQAKETN